MNEWNRISGIFARPRAVFEDLRERPRWIVPLVLLVVFLLAQAVLVFVFKIGFREQLQLLQDRVPAEQMAQVERTLQGPLPLIFGTIAIVVVTPAALLIVALILNVIAPLLGGEASFNRNFSIVTYASLIRIPAVVIKTVLMVLKGSTTVFTSLILALPFISQKSPLFNFFSRVDFFTIWELILVSLGVSVANRVTGKKTYYVVFGIWLGYLILTSFLLGTRFRMGPR